MVQKPALLRSKVTKSNYQHLYAYQLTHISLLTTQKPNVGDEDRLGSIDVPRIDVKARSLMADTCCAPFNNH